VHMADVDPRIDRAPIPGLVIEGFAHATELTARG
jgi:hypothetical protein